MKTFFDLPEWSDCLFKKLIPAGMEIRKDSNIVVLYMRKHEIHIAADISAGYDLNGELFNKVISPMILAIGERALELEFPGKLAEFNRIRKRRIELGVEEHGLRALLQN